jgi:transcription-repair coupling factor (superfamily II helicase)
MEKCTYCIQRINDARQTARQQDREIRTDEVVTACQAACPTDAIVFGDQNDPDSRVTRRKRQSHEYSLLEELNTRPRTTYLKSIVNPNPMLAFEDGAYDVLLSTTIVESGLDISGANTLIVERADRLGLAQLYQLRGRVGRRETEAWAYLFYPGKLTEQAQRRLYAIAELDDLGSGHLLAEKDMEIRGVGNLLGAEQHGHISSVSIEVYTELLAEEIGKLKGEQEKEERPVVAIDLNLDARLSPSYIQDDDVRINYYGRLSETDSLAEVGRIAREMREAFGPFPAEVAAFIDLVKIRLLGSAKGLATIAEHMTDIQLSFADDQESLDYNAKELKGLPYSVEPTRYPPGFSLKKRGLKGEAAPHAIQQFLYLVG